MAKDKSRRVTEPLIRTTVGWARGYLNENHPERATRMRDRILEFRRLRSIEDRIGSIERAMYRGVSADPTIHDWESKIYSQNGEDGILLNLFSRIGATSRRTLEFGCSTGLECNSANLVIGFGWSALLLDANATHITKARTFFDDHLGSHRDRVELRAEFVTPANINQLLAEATPAGEELDLLSIDIDSSDYWVWEAVEGFSPRVVVCEYNASFGPTRSVTVTPRDGFDPFDLHPSGFYHGASIAALHTLGTARGYQLIGTDSSGVNAFFVRRDCAAGLPDLDPVQAYTRSSWRLDPADPEEQFRVIQHLPLTEI